MKKQLFHLIFYFEAGAKTEFDIIQWAMNQVINGQNSDPIIKLAALQQNEKNKVRGLFQTVIQDLGYEYPSKQDLGYYRAKLISENMINGSILPEKSCTMIRRIYTDLNSPDLLAEWGQLNLTITDSELEVEILNSAHRLIKNVDNFLKLE